MTKRRDTIGVLYKGGLLAALTAAMRPRAPLTARSAAYLMGTAQALSNSGKLLVAEALGLVERFTRSVTIFYPNRRQSFFRAVLNIWFPKPDAQLPPLSAEELPTRARTGLDRQPVNRRI